MKMSELLEEIEVFRQRLLSLDESHTNFTAFDSKLTKNDLDEFLSNIQLLSETGSIDNELLISIDTLANNKHIENIINFKRLDLSDLSMDETHPDNGDVDDLIDYKSEIEYDNLRQFASPIIEELNTKLEQLLFIPESLQ
jgi:hypothetical protein